MITAPAVSVVITCFNLGQYLDDAVESVLAQTFQDFEILIVDDGSTDETAAKLASCAWPKTRVVRTENRGLSAARNTGIRNTTGGLLCMLDADDCLEPTYLEKSVAALREDSSLTFVSHWLRAFGDETWEWTPRECDLRAFFPANPINGAALFRREAWATAGGFDEAMREGLEDWDFWLTIVERGGRGRILPEFLFRYRRRKGSMSQTMHRASYGRLYRALIDKHSDSFRQYLPAVFRDVETETGELEAHIVQIENERYEWLEPALLGLRDDVAVLEAKVAQHHERLRIQAERDGLRAERDAIRAERDAAVHRLDEITAALNQVRAGIAELRQSASWRVTHPLRVVYEWIFRPKPKGGRRE